jgi:GTPase SAR1 family protein
VLLVSAHLPSRTLRCRWADGELLQETRGRSPALWAQASVTVALAGELRSATLPEIESSVLKFRRKELAISPASFFRARETVLSLGDRLYTVAEQAGLQSVEQLTRDVRQSLTASAYRLAVAGPARVGKSTLVNALLGVEISPVADYPTTAVPILFDAGEISQATVIFSDGRTQDVAPAAESLRPYAAQQQNALAGTDVRAVRVTLPNDMLARGVTLVDTPGLHDASIAVREVTSTAISEADAVLYVLDAGLGPKFKLGQAEIADLKGLQSSKERLIVVLNQSDALRPDQRASLHQYVERQLSLYGIWHGLPCAPVFVSAAQAWSARIACDPPPEEFQRLEDELWGHLLRTRATGLHRLGTAASTLVDACHTAAALLSDRAVKGSEAGELDRARGTCSSAVADLTRDEASWRAGMVKEIGRFLKARRTSRGAQFVDALRAVPADAPLPSTDDTQRRLQAEVAEDAREVWNYIQQQVASHTAQQHSVTQRALRDSSTQLGIPIGVNLEMPQIAPLRAIDLTLHEAHLGFWAGVLGFIANPVTGIIATVLGLIIGHEVGVKRRRAHVTAELSSQYRHALVEAHHHLERQACERLTASGRAVLDQARGRLLTFIADAERRIARLGVPITPEEAQRFRDAVADIGGLRESAMEVASAVARLIAI